MAITVMSGSPFRGLTKLQLQDTTNTNRRSWTVSIDSVTSDTATGNQTSWTTTPGGAGVTLTLNWDTVGTPLFAQSSTTTIFATLTTSTGTKFGTTTWSPSVTGNSGSTTNTLRFRDDPFGGSGGTDKHGMLTVYLQVQDNGTGQVYNLSSDGTNTTTPTGDNAIRAVGYYRAQATVTSVIVSNESLGGNTPTLFAFPDSTFNRVTTDTQPVRNYNGMTFKHRQSGADVRTTTALLLASNSTNADVSYTVNNSGVATSGRINKDYLKSASGVDIRVSPDTSTFGGTTTDNEQVFSSTVPTGFTATSSTQIDATSFITADPRISFVQDLQIGLNTWSQKPMNNDTSNGQRLASDLAFVASRAKNARGEGTNGQGTSTIVGIPLTWTEKLWDANGLVGTESSPVKSRSSTGTVQGGTTTLTGTISTTSGSTSLTGVGTLFTTETAVGQFIEIDNEERVYKISSITNDTALVLDRNANSTLTTKKGRVFSRNNISGTVSFASGSRTVTGTSTTFTTSLAVGDQIFSNDLDSKLYTVQSITNNTSLTMTMTASATVSGATLSRYSEVGWADGFLTWDNSLPGGQWNMKEVITSTSDAVGLEINNTRTLTLLASDPRINLIIGFGDPNTPKDHWYPGKALTIGIGIVKNGVEQTPDSGTAKISLLRFEPALQKISFLDPADSTLNTWTVLSPGGTITPFTTSTTPAITSASGDSNLQLLTFTGTQTGGSNWNYEDIFVIARIDVGSVTYARSAQFPVTGTANPHKAYSFDPTGLFK